ncbi:imidazoleglycerol-phosphate dehydratase [Mn(II)-dependent] [Candidatus Hydrogenisulfobacillus filiaventi]|uniref:Imidazoleglycerol-phosphate dehydratase n=1 Tax=Candidatus Hydrogenisulfobacillus filiaventi TaxID=2707344 RepID=A0A6F8ZEW7_9FIRM|nr:imidazoleglycerol-phosphate dehydratase [Bacillota bacterium]CAB1128234.1 imidazoleglycerol-phosphate dehydratase [Mn(II)-dependent] [Candidatus Hydrogenisulfobacillus filiaventi]
MDAPASRRAVRHRRTRETDVEVALDLDRPRPARIETDLPILTHFLSALALHGRLGLELTARGDVEVDPHHLVEDTGITLGTALAEALGDRLGIARFAHRVVPMDEALVLVAVDISGRGRAFYSGYPEVPVAGVAAEVWPEFFHGLAGAAGLTLHARPLAAGNAHHTLEATFKALGLALQDATRLLPDGDPDVRSTKGVL